MLIIIVWIAFPLLAAAAAACAAAAAGFRFPFQCHRTYARALYSIVLNCVHLIQLIYL